MSVAIDPSRIRTLMNIVTDTNATLRYRVQGNLAFVRIVGQSKKPGDTPLTRIALKELLAARGFPAY